jgi:hypothetical protein
MGNGETYDFEVSPDKAGDIHIDTNAQGELLTTLPVRVQVAPVHASRLRRAPALRSRLPESNASIRNSRRASWRGRRQPSNQC